MTTRFASKAEIKDWNTHILSNPDGGNVFQGSEFARQKKMNGWTPRFIIYNKLAITVLEKQPFGISKFWYIPKGPGIQSLRELTELLPHLKQFAQEQGVFAIKIEPELLKNDETSIELIKLGLQRVRPIQPNFSTITLNISDSLDSILAHLNQKGRHAIRRAERDGVTVQRVKASKENCGVMYSLLSETAAGSFGIRNKKYYETFWQRYADAGLGQLFFAYVDGKPVAGAYAIVFGQKSTYKDGASIRKRTAYGASHLLQWEVITWAKEHGSIIHDLCGAPPSDEINNPDHPHYGIGRFKTSFNKEVTDYVGAYDIIISPVTYKLWSRFGERIALRLYSYRYHESYY